MAKVKHGALVPGVASGIHIAPRWSVANAAGLAGLVVTAVDVAGIALQVDTKKLYWLSSSAPVTWVLLGDADKALAETLVQLINDQAGAYTVQASDVGKLIRINSATPVNVTVPDTFAIAAGYRGLISVRQTGAGQVTVVVTGTRVLLPNGLTNKTRSQGAEISLSLVGATECTVGGDVAVL